MLNLHRIIGFVYRKSESIIRPMLYQREKKRVLKRYPFLRPAMEAFEQHYIRVEYGAHDRSLMERMRRKMTDKDEFVYGSTPWSAFIKITDQMEISPEDVYIEPGCGTGHLCFFMNQVFGISTLGFEVIANFIETGNQIRQELAQQPESTDQRALDQQTFLKKVAFYNLDFFSCDFSRGSIFYIAGTCFPDDYRNKLVEKIYKEGKKDCTLITLTHELEHPGFELKSQVDAVFSWGRDKALIYQKISQTKGSP